MKDKKEKRLFKKFSRLRTKFEVTKNFINYLLVFIVIYLKFVIDLIEKKPLNIWIKCSLVFGSLSFIILTISIITEIRAHSFVEGLMAKNTIPKLRKYLKDLEKNIKFHEVHSDRLNNLFWHMTTIEERINIIKELENSGKLYRFFDKLDIAGMILFTGSIIFLNISFL